MKLVIFVFILGQWTASFANGTDIDGKLGFPVESSAERATPVSVSQSEVQALVRSYLRVLADAPDALDAVVLPAVVRSPYAAAAAAQTDALCDDGPCPTSNSAAKSAALNLPTLRPALCDAQGRCYLTLEPSYNVSDKDLGAETPIVPVIPIVPVYKGVAKGSDKDNGKNPSQDSDKELKPVNRTYVQFVRKLIPNYDFPVVPVYKTKNEVKPRHPQIPIYYNVNNWKRYGVSHPVTKVHHPSVFTSTGSHRPPFNVGSQYRPPTKTDQRRPVSTHFRYPYPYGQYGLQTRHNQGWTYFKSVDSLQSNSQGWVNVGPRGQSTGGVDYHGTGASKGVKGTGTISRHGCSSRCTGVMEHRGGSVGRGRASFNISGKLEFPKDTEEGTAALISEIQVDGKLGAM